MTASWPPTSTVASSPAVISSSVPATGDGISVSTLSVDTSSSGSSTATVSPTCLSQRVTVPSVTLSPRAGMVTGVPEPSDGADGADWAGAWPFCCCGSGCWAGALCCGAGSCSAGAS